ncbi:DUF1552 domain-containing protein [Brevifollis gellanilyticus]|uniref:DUF1552 domain-containing protein n=1 Tax=Brevifollis gellanilyticus TaxID=748831 RepID=A0A512MIM9_9BACT|nr:DUF1552 domain-containing protein [Brevifollis gellanilyticus]GEP46161.1 hypothetical protein BGE01nite_54520 [Brevifollis gellanilyticus]
MNIATKRHLDRRAFLRGTGAVLSLPFLEAMVPAFATRAQAAVGQPPPRFLAMCATLGFHTPFLFPQETGMDYTPTPYLEPLKDLRGDFSVISGLQHMEQNGANGHTSEMTWLTSAKHPGLAGFKNTISIDQLIAETVGTQTRFPSLVLGTGNESLSWSASGVPLPAESSPSKAFQQLFVDGTPKEIEAQVRGLKRGRSILDTVMGQAKKLHGELGKRDQEKLDEYFSAVRDLEGRLVQNEEWAQKPKPRVDAKPPTDIQSRTDAIGKMKLLQDLVLLALQTDSTRTVTLRLSGMNAVPEIEGVKNDWHNLSHHGQDQAKIDELKVIETAEFAALGDFLRKLKATQDNGRPLLDTTSVLFGSNLGNASAHSTANIPMLFAGGGYNHGRHIAVDKEKHVFSNLFVSVAQRMGVETDKFGFSTGVLDIDQA